MGASSDMKHTCARPGTDCSHMGPCVGSPEYAALRRRLAALVLECSDKARCLLGMGADLEPYLSTHADIAEWKSIRAALAGHEVVR